MKTSLKMAVAILLAVSLGACANSAIGTNFKDENAAQIVAGQTTKEQVQKILGEPTSRHKDGAQESWTYSHTTAQSAMNARGAGVVAGSAMLGFIPIVGGVAALAMSGAVTGQQDVSADSKTVSIEFKNGVVASCSVFRSKLRNSSQDSERSSCTG